MFFFLKGLAVVQPWGTLTPDKGGEKAVFRPGQEHAFGQRFKGRWIPWFHYVYQVEELNVEKCFHGFHFPTP
jgi:hypothetical protein